MTSRASFLSAPERLPGELQARLFASDAAAEGIAATVEKRAPRFEGR